MVTCSVFAPNPQLVFDQLEQSITEDNPDDPNADQKEPESKNATSITNSSTLSGSETKFNTNASFSKKDKPTTKVDKSNPGPGYVVISGDYDGEIKVFYNATKPKHSSLP